MRLEVLMTAVVIAANVIISNLNNCMLVGSICGACSCSSVPIDFGGSFHAHDHHLQLLHLPPL